MYPSRVMKTKPKKTAGKSSRKAQRASDRRLRPLATLRWAWEQSIWDLSTAIKAHKEGLATLRDRESTAIMKREIRAMERVYNERRKKADGG